MSCGAECQEALAKLHLLLDKEGEAADMASVEKHLDECSYCLDEYTIERLLKTLVSRSCRESAPEVLRQRVLLTIRTMQIDLTWRE